MSSAPDGFRPLRIAAVRQAADRILSIDLCDPGGVALPAWTPGAHIDVVAGPGRVRQYSLCGDPADRSVLRIAVQREPGGGGSAHLHDTAAPGATLLVGEPRSHFGLVPARRHKFVAGGIGITPLLPMLVEASRRGEPWSLLYGARSHAAMAFSNEIAALGGDVALVAQDTDGMPDIGAHLGPYEDGDVAYVCGPSGMIEAVEAHCWDWPSMSVRKERFAASAPAQPDADVGSFEVSLARSRRTLTVGAHESILEALERAGLDVPSSCQAGICGACETRVLAGVPLHNDDVLTDEERARNDVMMVCVSRCREGPLILDR